MNTTVEAQYASGASTLRAGKGALYVKSAGNGFDAFGSAFCGGAAIIGVSCQNANFDPSNTLPYNIVMAALNAQGVKSSYSTAGSAIWVSAPGGEFGNNLSVVTSLGLVAVSPTSYDPAMVTVDQSGCAKGFSRNPGTIAGPYSTFNLGGINLSSINLNCNYTNTMNGTSSAAPVMSGALALILEANPALTWRDVKHILANSARQVDAGRAAVIVPLTGGSYTAEQAWVTNAAGYKYHNWYGFGAVDVSAAVTLALGYTPGSLGTFSNTDWINSGTLSLAIPDNSITGASSIINVPNNLTIEAVQIKVTATHPHTSDLGIELTAPSGKKSILKNIRDGFGVSTGLSGMVLASNAFYGETSTGVWTIKVVDGAASNTGTLTNWQIRIYGH
jgi:hypothetical protein